MLGQCKEEKIFGGICVLVQVVVGGFISREGVEF